MKKTILFLFVISSFVFGQDYVGVENCANCHAGTKGTFPGYAGWEGSLHSKIHMAPSPATMRGDYTKTVSMGSNYGNATVSFRVDAGKYYIQLNPSSGSPVEREVIYTYGFGWKQRYLVKIENSYYIQPVQWNLKGYLDNSSGAWVSYNPQNWFNADGTLKPLNNTLRSKSWDKNCAGCHVVPGKKTSTVQKVVTGADTAWVYNWANSNSIKNIVVGCESCHSNPTAAFGTGHVNNLKNLSYDRKIEVCAQCHFRGASKNHTYEYPYNENTDETYKVGEDLFGYISLAPGLWPDGKTSKQHHQQWQDYKYSKHYNPNNGMTCVTCHDPHQTTAQSHQLTDNFYSLSSGVGCVKCHTTKTTETNGINNHSRHPQTVSQCVNCHMTKNAKSALDYDISNHSFLPIRPIATITFAASSGGMLNTCAVACHRNGTGNRGSGKNFGITDASLTNWAETTDLALADTLWRYYQEFYISYLPVELASFSSVPTENGIILTWKTTTEKNNSGFEVEKSTDQSSWVLVQFVNGNGTSLEEHTYKITDSKPFNGKSYYRLRQLDFDGTATIVSSIQVDMIAPNQFTLAQNYPNPFNPATTIKYSLPFDSKVRISIYNALGQRIEDLLNETKEAGNHEVQFMANALTSGVYLYEIVAVSRENGREFRSVKKMTLLK